MNNEFLHMQKLAGLITEGEYQAKMNEGDYDSMSDHALIKAANEAGIEEMVEMDGEGGLANREEVIDHLNEFEHDNHGSFDAEMNGMEGEDYDDPRGGHSPDRYWGTDYRAQNEVEEGDDKQKKFADYIYNEYLKDAKQPMTAMRLSQEIMNDTDSRINPVYIKAAIKAHYPEIELKENESSSDTLNESLSHTLTADEYRRKESPHLDAHGGNEVDFMDAMEFAKDYARYVASIACQEFLDTTLSQEAIDEFLKGFGL